MRWLEIVSKLGADAEDSLAWTYDAPRREPDLPAETPLRLSTSDRTRGARAVLRQNSVRREVVDLPALIRRRSWFDDHPPAPAASPPALSLRRPPPARPRKPRLAPAARRLQANGAPAQQIVDAFPDDSAPSYLLRDRDSIYGHAFRQRVKGMGISEVLTAPLSPWQNPFAERLIGSIRHEGLNHVLVLGERHLRCILAR